MKKSKRFIKLILNKLIKILITIFDEYRFDSLYLKFIVFLFITIFIVGVLEFSYNAIMLFLNNSASGDLVSFIGNVVGAIIGGVFTFIALGLTIRNERKKEDKTQRLNFKPYMCYEILPLIDIKDCKNTYKVDLTKQDLDKVHYTTKYIKVLIKNLGLNSALNFNIYDISYKGKISDIYSNQIIGVDDEVLLSFKVNLDMNMFGCSEGSYSSKVKFTVIYNDHLENYYEQDVTIYIKYDLLKDNEYSEKTRIEDIYKLHNLEITEKHSKAKYHKYKVVKSQIDKFKLDFK